MARQNLDTDVLKVMLVNSPAPVATNTVKANLTEITPGNGYPAGGTDIVGVWTESPAGTGSLAGTDVTWTASGGTIGPFRYVVLYNDTPTTPLADPVIGWWDYGSNVTLQIGESFVVDFTGPVLTLT